MPESPAASQRKSKRKRDANLSIRIGERVANARKDRHLKVSELARAVQVSPSLISQIERGQSQPSVSTLFALSEALDVPVDALFAREPSEENGDAAPAPPAREKTPRAGAAPSAAGAPVSVAPQTATGRYMVDRNERESIDIEGGVRWERLTPTIVPQVEFMELIYQPGAESNPGLYRHPGSEMVLMLSGQLEITVGFETYSLEAGDSIHFPSSVPHRYVNPTDEVARAVTVIIREDYEDLPEIPVEAQPDDKA